MDDGEPHSAAPLTWLAAAFVAASSSAIVQIGSDARWLAAIGALIAPGPCDSARGGVRGRAVERVARRAGARAAHLPRPRVALRRQGPRPRADRRRHDRGRRARARSPARRRARRGGRDAILLAVVVAAPATFCRAGQSSSPWRSSPCSSCSCAPSRGSRRGASGSSCRCSRCGRTCTAVSCSVSACWARISRSGGLVPHRCESACVLAASMSRAARDARAARHRLVLRRRPARRRRVGALRALGAALAPRSRSICCSSRSPCRSSSLQSAAARQLWERVLILALVVMSVEARRNGIWLLLFAATPARARSARGGCRSSRGASRSPASQRRS